MAEETDIHMRLALVLHYQLLAMLVLVDLLRVMVQLVFLQ